MTTKELIDAALNNQERPDVAMMYAIVAIAQELKELNQTLDTTLGAAVCGNGALAVRSAPWQ